MSDRSRDDEVQRIARLVETDSYEVAALDVADAVLARWAMRDVVDRFESYSAAAETEDDSSNP